MAQPRRTIPNLPVSCQSEPVTGDVAPQWLVFRLPLTATESGRILAALQNAAISEHRRSTKGS